MVSWFLVCLLFLFVVIVQFLLVVPLRFFVFLLFFAQRSPAERKACTSKQVVAAVLVDSTRRFEIQIVVQKEIVTSLSSWALVIQLKERRTRILIVVGGGRKRKESIEVGSNGDFLGSIVQKEGGLLCERSVQVN